MLLKWALHLWNRFPTAFRLLSPPSIIPAWSWRTQKRGLNHNPVAGDVGECCQAGGQKSSLLAFEWGRKTCVTPRGLTPTSPATGPDTCAVRGGAGFNDVRYRTSPSGPASTRLRRDLPDFGDGVALGEAGAEAVGLAEIHGLDALAGLLDLGEQAGDAGGASEESVRLKSTLMSKTFSPPEPTWNTSRHGLED